MLSLSHLGCIGKTSNNQDSDSIVIGTITSSDKDYIDLEENFTFLEVQVKSAGSLQSSSEIQQTFFKVYDVDLPDDLNARNRTAAIWALAFRTESNPVGIYRAEGIGIQLFRNHTVNNGPFVNDNVTFKDHDIADSTYDGISGWVLFEESGVGEYEVQFQQVVDIDSGKTAGQVVTVSGSFDMRPFISNSGY